MCATLFPPQKVVGKPPIPPDLAGAAVLARSRPKLVTPFTTWVNAPGRPRFGHQSPGFPGSALLSVGFRALDGPPVGGKTQAANRWLGENADPFRMFPSLIFLYTRSDPGGSNSRTEHGGPRPQPTTPAGPISRRKTPQAPVFLLLPLHRKRSERAPRGRISGLRIMGAMEHWNVGLLGRAEHTIPHHSMIPTFHPSFGRRQRSPPGGAALA